MAEGGEAKPWHGPDGRFRNPPGSPANGGTRGGWWAFAWRRFREGRHPPPGLPADLVLPPHAVRRGIADLGGADGITWLGHACFLIHLAGRRLLTDPFLSDYASPYRWLGPHRHTPPALRALELPPVDLVLLSHAHCDHLDLPALAALPGKGRAAPVTGLGMGRYLAGLGFARLVEMDWHETVALAGLEITALPAIHFNRRTERDRNRALWCGFVAAGGGRRGPLPGDTPPRPGVAPGGPRHPRARNGPVAVRAPQPRPPPRGRPRPPPG